MSAITVTVASNGQPIDSRYVPLSVEVRRELNRIPAATLVYADGGGASRRFDLCDSGVFAPGRKVAIQARYEAAGDAGGQDDLLFEGMVVGHGIDAGAAQSVLRVELRDAAVKLTQPRRSRTFQQIKDSLLIQSLASSAGLQATVSGAEQQHESLVQYDCSDWDLLVSRAQANGLVVAVTNGRLEVKPPQMEATASITLAYGIGRLTRMEFETSGLGHSPGFQARGWDAKAQSAQVADAAAPPPASQGQLTAQALASSLGFGAATLLHPVPLGSAELQAWADSEAQRSQFSLVRGRASLPGQSGLRLLQTAQVSGGPACYAGRALVSGLYHHIDQGGWRTDLLLGLSPRPFSEQEHIQSPAAAGRLPAISGLHVGVVQAIQADPDNEFRINVKLPGLPDDAGELWARLAMPDAGATRGWYFRPEPGDEVVLGFFNQDPRCPVVLGSLFSGKNKVPDALQDAGTENQLRGLVSRSGITIGLVDGDKAKLYFKTPGQRQVLLDDEGGVIELSDPHGNKLTLDKDGIKLVSARDFKLEAPGNVEIKGSKIDLK